MAADQFSKLMGDGRGAARPVAEAATLPQVILLRNPGDRWWVSLLREKNELLLNIAELGLSTTDDRELICDLGALLVAKLQENPDMSDGELDDLTVYGLELFRAMPLEERAKRNLTT